MGAAFDFTITKQTIQGDRKVVYGTFVSSGGAEGGNIVTGLRVVEHFEMQHTGSAVVTEVPVANATFPLSGAAPVPIVTVLNTAGLWKAIGT